MWLTAYLKSPLIANQGRRPALRRPWRCVAGGRGFSLALRRQLAGHVRAFLDGDTPTGDSAFDRPALSQVHFVASGDGPDDRPEDRHAVRDDVGQNRRVRSDRQHVIGKVDFSLDLAVDGQVLRPGDFPFDAHGTCRVSQRDRPSDQLTARPVSIQRFSVLLGSTWRTPPCLPCRVGASEMLGPDGHVTQKISSADVRIGLDLHQHVRVDEARPPAPSPWPAGWCRTPHRGRGRWLPTARCR